MSNEIDYAKEINDRAEKTRKEVAEAHKLYVEREQQKREDKQRELNAKMEQEKDRKKFEEEQSFFYESPRQKQIRLRMRQIGDTVDNINSSSSYVEYAKERVELLLKEYRDLKEEYTKIPFNIGKQEFKEILHYETANGDKQLISKDGSKTFSLFEYQGNGVMAKSLKQVESLDGKPTKIHRTFATDYIKRFFRGLEMPTSITIELLDANGTFEKKQGNIPYRLKFTWQCSQCHKINDDDESMVCSCGAKRVM